MNNTSNNSINMNNGSLSSQQTPPILDLSLKGLLSSYIVADIVGVVAGSAVYVISHTGKILGFNRLDAIRSTYGHSVLTGVKVLVVLNTAIIVNETAQRFLKNREKYENLSSLENLSNLDKLQYYSWQYINKIEIFYKNSNVKSIIESNLALGAYVGVACFLATKILVSRNFLSNPTGAAITLGPYIAAGVSIGIIKETIKFIHLMGAKFLFGKEIHDSKNARVINYLRNKTWKIIKFAEGVTDRIDTLSSKILSVRTAKEIKNAKIPDYELFKNCSTKQELIEIIRRSCLESLSTSYQNLTNSLLPVYLTHRIMIKQHHYIIPLELINTVYEANFVFNFISSIYIRCHYTYEKMEWEKTNIDRQSRSQPALPKPFIMTMFEPMIGINVQPAAT